MRQDTLTEVSQLQQIDSLVFTDARISNAIQVLDLIRKMPNLRKLQIDSFSEERGGQTDTEITYRL